MDKRMTIAAVVKTLATNAGVETTPDVLRLYGMALDQFEPEQIEQAAIAVLRTWRWNRMPPVAVILDEIPGAKVPSIEHKALAEANRIVSHLHYHGKTVVPDLSDPITRHLMTSRWPYQRWAATVEESDLKWWVKEFVEAYQAVETTGPPPAAIPHTVRRLLAGIGGSDHQAIEAPALVAEVRGA